MSFLQTIKIILRLEKPAWQKESDEIYRKAIELHQYFIKGLEEMERMTMETREKCRKSDEKVEELKARIKAR